MFCTDCGHELNDKAVMCIGCGVSINNFNANDRSKYAGFWKRVWACFIDGIIMPTLQPFLDRVQTDNATIQIGNITINLEKFIQAFIKFLALAIVVYMLLKFGVEMSRPVQWVSVRSVAAGAKL